MSRQSRQNRRRGGSYRSTSSPKPYGIVPLPDRVDRKKPAGHERYHQELFTGRIEGVITALSPLHVGSGIIDLDSSSLIKTHVETIGKVIIPGSSLKGAIRSVVESITESCVCKTGKELKNKLRDTFPECKSKESLCVSCRMFGAMGFQGNLSIFDAPMIEGSLTTKRVPEMYKPGGNSRVYLDRSGEITGRKFYMHGKPASGNTPVQACEVDSKFAFSLNGDNLSKAEWGTLLIALGQYEKYAFKLKIGGLKPACFGSVDVKIDKIQVESDISQRYLNWDDESRHCQKDGNMFQSSLDDNWMEQCMNQALGSLIKLSQLEKLAQILGYPNNRNCPSGVY